MKKNEADELVIKTFKNEYNDNNYLRFIKEVIDGSPKYGSVEYHNPEKIYENYIEGYRYFGVHRDSEGKRIIFVAVKLSKLYLLDRARVMQRNFAADLLRGYASRVIERSDAALIAFYTDSSKDWRLSLVTFDTRLDTSNGKLKVSEILTPARRSSFLVGKSEPCYTCQKRFENLLVDESHTFTLSLLEDVFKVEAVTDDFFDEYKNCFNNLSESLQKIVDTDENVKRELQKHDIKVSEFSKRLLGQIVFLYFLQKKGWLGVELNKEWGTGPKDFMNRLFKKEIVPYKNFFDDILEPLFYEALARDRRKYGDYYSRFNVRIPFLNGGLFESQYDWVKTHIIIENSVFEKIFETLERYNFTIKEDEPLEREVAVDPEMLGKVFERLLDVTERKDKGAFYTPRFIVHYICQQSLIEYLSRNTTIPKEDIESFIQKGDVLYAATIKSGSKGNDGLPENIRNNAIVLDDLLSNIKVADPAVGSGAFPVGMMNEIVKARNTLSATKDYNFGQAPGRTIYDLKRQTMEQCIYGVDLDPSAVDIAKLRFWLSLIVDEDHPKEIRPLPNLDHKIMVGNSLLDSFHGIKLFDERLLDEYKSKKEEIEALMRECYDITAKIDTLSQQFTSDKSKESEECSKLNQRKQAISKKLNRLKYENKEKNLIQSLSEEEIIEFKKSINKLNELENLQKIFFNEQDKHKKDEIRNKIDSKAWDIIESEAIRSNNQQTLDELQLLRSKRGKPFFLWKLYYSEVFKRENPGFDCIIGNPPYIQLQSMSKEVKSGYEGSNFSTYIATGDIYCLFYEQGWRLLRDGGTLGYITSNKWMRAGYGEKTRYFFANSTNPLKLIDFSGNKVFEEATVDVNILLFEKSENKHQTRTCYVGNNYIPNSSISDFIDSYSDIKALKDNASWAIIPETKQRIKDKVEKMGTPLKDWDISIYRGILTGYNPAFIISGKQRQEILSQCENKKERDLTEKLIQPILAGKDINKYGYLDKDRWLIATFPSRKYDIDNYPSVKKWLLSHGKERLEPTGKVIGIDGDGKEIKSRKKGSYKWFETQDSIAYWDNFNKNKIIYPNMTKYLPFIYDERKYLTNQKCFIITGNHICFLTAFFNSSLFKYCFRDNFPELQGGTRELSKIFFDKIPVPDVDDKTDEYFRNIILKIQNLIKEGKNTTELEKEIDQKIFDIYNLSKEEQEEIGFIEIT